MTDTNQPSNGGGGASLSLPPPDADQYSLIIEPSQDTLVTSGFNPYGTLKTVTQPEIVTTLQQLPIEMEVINKAIDIYYQLNADSRFRTKSVKGTRKNKLMFYCIFTAYDELDAPVDPCYAAERVGLNQNDIEKAFKEYAPRGVTLFKPERLVRFYIMRLNQALEPNGIHYDVSMIVNGVTDVINACRSTRAGEEWVQNTAARIVAISVLYFYMHDLKRLDINSYMSTFESACYLSWACIRRYHEQVDKYYNLDQDEQEDVEINWSYF